MTFLGLDMRSEVEERVWGPQIQDEEILAKHDQEAREFDRNITQYRKDHPEFPQKITPGSCVCVHW